MQRIYEANVTVRTVYHVQVEVDDMDDIEEMAVLKVCESNLNDYESMDVETIDVFDESGKTVCIT